MGWRGPGRLLWHVAVVCGFTSSGWLCSVCWQRMAEGLPVPWLPVMSSPCIQTLQNGNIIAMELRPEDQRPLQVVPSLLGATACEQMS